MTSALLIEPVAFQGRRTELSPLAKSILLTVHYRDLFCHALTADELAKYLLLMRADPDAVRATVNQLARSHLSRVGEYITWKGRESLAQERPRRLAASQQLWCRARQYGRLVQRVPFLRMAGVSGSLAINHASETRDDVDLFCIAEANRVWIAMFFLRCIHGWSRRFGMAYLCANTCLAEDQLQVTSENLYMAHQIAHVVPLWGMEVHQRFLNENQWVRRFLPNAFPSAPNLTPALNRALPHAAEKLLPGWLGDRLNGGICRVGVRKARRFYRATHTDEALRAARNPARYMLPGLGYTGNVFRRFMDGHATRFGSVMPRAEMEAVFGCRSEVFFDPRLERVFRWKYGDDH